MIHSTEIVDVREGELTHALLLAFAALLQNSTNPLWVNAVLVIRIQSLLGGHVGQERQSGR